MSNKSIATIATMGIDISLDETNGADHILRRVAEDDVVEARGVSVEAFSSDSSEIATDVLAVSIEPCA